MQKTKTRKIGFKLTIIVVCGLLIGIALTTGIALYISSGVITNEIIGRMEASVEDEANQMDAWVVLQQSNVTTMANIIGSMDVITRENLMPLLQSVWHDNPDYSDVYMGFTDNTAMMASEFPIENEYSWWRATERDWYQLALRDTSTPAVTQPYIDTSTGDLCISVSRAVIHDGVIVGVVGADIQLPVLTAMVRSIELDEGGYAMLVGSDGDIFIHPRDYGPNDQGVFYNLHEMLGGRYAELWKIVSQQQAECIEIDPDGIESYFFAHEIAVLDWHLVAVLPTSATTRAIIEMILLIVPITLGITALASLIMYLMVDRIVTKPVSQLVTLAGNVANGELNVNIPQASNDELGLLSAAFGDVVRIINKLVSELSELGVEINTNGDTDARADAMAFDGSYKEVADTVNKVIGGLISDINNLMSAMTAFGAGDLSADIPQMPGKKAIMNENLNTLRGNINSVTNDVNKLAASARSGDFSFKIDEGRYIGDWKTLMSGLNQVIDAVSAPLKEIEDVLNDMARGEFDKRIKGAYKGEFLTVKQCVNTTMDNIISYIDEISHVLQELANNNLNQEITREYVGSFTNIKNALNNIITMLNRVLGDISAAADQVDAGAKQLLESSMTLADGATQQTGSIQGLNHTILGINESSAKNAENAKNAKELSENSKKNAAKGDEDMQQMLVSMDGIKSSSQKITTIIKVIEDIAFQTNLLALNAAVEAARAGVHGVGFAVVADEVRTLANRSHTASKETSELIEESIRQVEDGTAIAEQTAAALRTITEDVSKVADIISGISAVSDEQTNSVNFMASGLSQITEVVEQNAAASEETAAASEQLSSQSEIMRNLVKVFIMKK